MEKAQGSIEYLLLLGGAIVVVGMIAIFIMGTFSEGEKSAQQQYGGFGHLVGWEGETTGRLEAEWAGDPGAPPGLDPALYPCDAAQSIGWFTNPSSGSRVFNTVYEDVPFFNCTLPADLPEGEYYITYSGWYNSPEIFNNDPDHPDAGETLRVWKVGDMNTLQRSTDQWVSPTYGDYPDQGEIQTCTFPKKVLLKGGDQLRFEGLDMSVWVDWFKVHEKYISGQVCYDNALPIQAVPDISIPEALLMGLLSIAALYFILGRGNL